MFDIVLLMPIANRFDKVSVRIPNGLLAIAALPDLHGYKVKIIDLKIDRNWKKTLKNSIGKSTICVGIACSTGRMISSALEIAKETRMINANVPIVWGGPHPTLVSEQTLLHPLVDIVVINEGDYTFLNLVQTIEKKKDLLEVNGIGFKDDTGTMQFTQPRELVANLDELPMLPYHLLDIKKYSTLTVDGQSSIDILTSRGCPFACTFCSTPITSKRRWRPMSVDRIMEYIHHLYEKYDIRIFYLIDDNFMVDLSRVEKFCDIIIDSSLDIKWGTQGVTVHTLNNMSPELLDKTERSGCLEFSIGIESANPEILKEIDKKVIIDDVLANNRKLSGRKMAIKYNMIIGFPGETLEQIQKTVDLAVELQKSNKKAWFPFNIFTPFPGTPEFDNAVKHGFNPPQRLEEWIKLESVGWGKYYNYWFEADEIELLQSINFTSYLAFPAAAQKISNPLLKFLFRLYQPIAKFRFKNNFYIFHFEKYIFQEKESDYIN